MLKSLDASKNDKAISSKQENEIFQKLEKGLLRLVATSNFDPNQYYELNTDDIEDEE